MGTDQAWGRQCREVGMKVSIVVNRVSLSRLQPPYAVSFPESGGPERSSREVADQEELLEPERDEVRGRGTNVANYIKLGSVCQERSPRHHCCRLSLVSWTMTCQHF